MNFPGSVIGEFSGISGMFSIFFIMFIVAFVLVIGVWVFRGLSVFSSWSSDNSSPVLTVDSKVISKRTMIVDSDRNAYKKSVSRYFATFEVESGDRIELKVPDTEIGLIAEGDMGMLKFQGKRFITFKRTK